VSLSKKTWVPLAVLAFGLMAMAIVIATRKSVEPEPRAERTPLVRTLDVVSEPALLIVRAHGTVVPRREGDLVPQVSGSVVWVSPALASGGFFEEGEPLVRIDRADYEVALESARAAVARSESEFDRATKELARQKRLAARSVASQALFDDAKNAERVSAAALREAQARLEQALRDIDRTELRAPYVGRVREENVDVGQFVTRGASLGRIYAVDFAEVRLPIPDAELDFLELPLLYRDPGSEAGPRPRVQLRARFAGRDHVWEGEVVRTEGEIDPRSRMVHVVARVADPYGRTRSQEERGERPPLAVGLFVEADILGRQIEDAVILPRTALREGDRVLVVDADMRLFQRAVQVVRVESERAVVSGGLRDGERVVISPMRAVIDGMTVRVQPAVPAATAAQAQGGGPAS
jgi:RND family efflux transporter MFP subunit